MVLIITQIYLAPKASTLMENQYYERIFDIFLQSCTMFGARFILSVHCLICCAHKQKKIMSKGMSFRARWKHKGALCPGVLRSLQTKCSHPHYFQSFCVNQYFQWKSHTGKTCWFMQSISSKEILLHNKFEQYFGSKQENQYCNCMLREMDIMISPPLYVVKEKVTVLNF